VLEWDALGRVVALEVELKAEIDGVLELDDEEELGTGMRDPLGLEPRLDVPLLGILLLTVGVEEGVILSTDDAACETDDGAMENRG
jgi:hypothetical protein